MNEKNLTPFKPGQSGNPKGRGQGVPNTKTRLKRFLEIIQEAKNPITGEIEKLSVAEQMDLMQLAKALKKGDSYAYAMLLDRLEGKPNQTITNDGTVTFKILDPNEPKKEEGEE